MSEIVVVKQFGPSIGKTKIPTDIIEYLNNYIDKIIENKKKSNELDHGNKLAGDVTQEFALERQRLIDINIKMQKDYETKYPEGVQD